MELNNMGQVSIMGFYEFLALLGPVLLLLLMPIGFIGSAWVTNSVFNMLGRDVDEVTALDKAGSLILLVGLFATYSYLISSLFVE